MCYFLGDELGKLLIDASGADEQSKSLLKTIAASSMLFQPSFSYNAAYLSDSVGGINSAATAPNQIVKKTINGGKAALQRKVLAYDFFVKFKHFELTINLLEIS